MTQSNKILAGFTLNKDEWLLLELISDLKYRKISFSSIVPEYNESLILELSNEFETKSMYQQPDFHFINTFIKEFLNGFENLKIDCKLRNIAYVSFF